MSDRIAAIHQPNYLPWIGFFNKIHRSDVFVFMDDAEYSSGSWLDRNRVKTPDGWTWLTVPVQKSKGLIKEAQINQQQDWRSDHWKTFTHNYGGAEYFENWRPFLEETYDREWEYLYPLDRHLIEGICDRVGIDYEFVDASTLNVDAKASERLAELCNVVDADTYLCGMGADDYMEDDVFYQRGISVTYQDFDHPTYEQRFDEFVPNMTFLDAVLNIGSEAAHELVTSL